MCIIADSLFNVNCGILMWNRYFSLCTIQLKASFVGSQAMFKAKNLIALLKK